MSSPDLDEDEEKKEVVQVKDEEQHEYVEEGETTIPENLITFQYSFGYDCKRLFNLCLIDDDTLVFASGNYIHYFKISTREMSFRVTQFDCGIGFITKNEHPDYGGLLTIAENGPTPTVFIYEYPSHDIRIKLEGGAKSIYTCGSYNATGDLFASQAGYPDFMLTIWRWENAEVLLRAKSYQNDVLYVHFSRFNPILLVSCGLSHIKFWKMAHTFTGIKLKGELGRFGKTDFSDIYSAYMLSDENVISGCEWGNMLVWEAGLIKFEICRKGRKPCHTMPITRITMDNGEVTTVGMDGYVRIWFWETVDLADPPDDDRFVEIEPIYEFRIPHCEMRSVQKIKPFDPTHFGYYVQDGNGGIWYCDLNVYDEPEKAYKLFSCPGGKILTADISPISKHVLVVSENGKFFVYDYSKRKLILEKKYRSVANDVIWLKSKVSKNGLEVVGGFSDGVLRHLFVDLESHPEKLVLISAIKSHTAAITKLSINPKSTILVSGSEDKTIFMYQINDIIDGFVHIKPMGFVQLNAVPSVLNWSKHRNSDLIIGSKTGEIYAYKLPYSISDEQTFLSYNITKQSTKKSTKFVSVKSRIRRDLKREETKKRKELKRQRKLKEIEKLKAANPGLQIDMDSALADSEPEEEEEPLFIPHIPNPILLLKITKYDTVSVIMGGYDAGYVYEMNFTNPEPISCTMIKDADDCEIHGFLRVEDCHIYGLINGKIRISRRVHNNFQYFDDYRLFSMHDALRGKIPKIMLGYDSKEIISVGYDGNIFMYNWNGPKAEKERDHIRRSLMFKFPGVEDIELPTHPSLEEEKIHAEMKRQKEALAAHDRKILIRIGELQVKFNDIMRKNMQLRLPLQFTHRDLSLDPRITEQIASELQAQLDDVREDLAYDLEVAQVGKKKLYDYFLKELDHVPIQVYGIGAKVDPLKSFRLLKLGDQFQKIKEEIAERLRQEAAMRNKEEKQLVEPELQVLTMPEEKDDSILEPPIETFFFGRDPNTILPRFSPKMLRLLRRYRARQHYEVERLYKWEKLQRQKPDPNKNHPDDDQKIKEAEKNLGDYKLKIGADFEPDPTDNLTQKYISIVECCERHHKILDDFNQRVLKMRADKKKICENIAEKRKRLGILHKLLSEENRLYLPELTDIIVDEEYPELNLIEHYKPGCGVNIEDILYLEKNVSDFLPKPMEQVTKAGLSKKEIYEMEQYFTLDVHEMKSLPPINEVVKQIASLPNRETHQFYESAHGSTPAWMVELRYRCLLKALDEQQSIIYTVRDLINTFNTKLHELCFARYFVKFTAEFLLCYMITLNQELYIMRDSEEIENRLNSNADAAMQGRNDIQAKLNVLNRQIDEGRKSCDKIADHISTAVIKFMTTIKGHKFFDFLRRIFKKKYRRPKPPKGDDESSDSSSSDSSSSEDEDDTKSIDSMDMTAIRLDESVCPAGLEKPMYDLAFKMRSERHALEQLLIDTQKSVEQKRIDVLTLQKDMKEQEAVFNQEMDNLMKFKRKRQLELNKVEVAVVLRMDQIQHFQEGEDFRDLSKAVLFDAARLNALKERVNELKVETLETKRAHRLNIVHLRRMNADIKFMRFEIRRLDDAIKEEMVKKFGFVIDLDELEEEVLRKYIFELETSAEDDLNLIEKELKKRKLKYIHLQDELIKETKANTEKLNILTVLQEEKNYLDEALAAQEKNYDKWFKPPVLNLDRDIEKLLAIEKQQKEQIKSLEREICTLRMKVKPLQIDPERSEDDMAVNKEASPTDETFVCPEPLTADAYLLRLEPDEFVMARVLKIVQKCLNKHLCEHTTKENIRKYAQKIARYLGQAAFSFEGKITDPIMDCITESLQTIVPKKYLIYVTDADLHQLLNEVLALFDYLGSEVNMEDVILGVYSNAFEALQEMEIINKTQFVLEEMFKQLIEVLPVEDFKSEKTMETIVQILEKEPYINPKCIAIEKIVETVVKHAKDNLLDGITAVPIRRLADSIRTSLMELRQNEMEEHCSMGSVASVTISAKNP